METTRSWPDGFSIETSSENTRKIKAFISEELEALKDLDKKRRKWIESNLPPAYRMNYIFHEHSLRVAENIKQTALHMGLEETVAGNLYWAMLAHDIGKTRLPVNIWDSMEKPEDDLKALRRTHTDLGVQIVQEKLGDTDHPFKDLMTDIIRHHHEQMDGGGPHGIKGENLSAPVRLACIVESFDGYGIPRPHFENRDLSSAGVLRRMWTKGPAIYDMELFEDFAEMKMNASHSPFPLPPFPL